MPWTDNWEDLTDEDMQKAIDEYALEAATLAQKVFHDDTESSDAKRLAAVFLFIDGFLTDLGPLPQVWASLPDSETSTNE